MAFTSRPEPRVENSARVLTCYLKFVQGDNNKKRNGYIFVAFPKAVETLSLFNAVLWEVSRSI